MDILAHNYHWTAHSTKMAPEGETVVAPVALWNKRHVEPPPGSQLWLGFSAHVLPEKYADLNDQIVSVLTQRVPD